MKITDVTVILAREWRTFLFVIIDTDEGIYGVGESGITGRELAIAGAIEHFKPLLIGEDPFRTEHIWQRLFRVGFYPAQKILTAAIAAIDIALWDIKGKATGLPVYQLLGGQVRDKVASYNHVHGSSTEEIIERIQEAINDGWKFTRLELPHEKDNSIEPRTAVVKCIEQFEAIRGAVGDKIEICYDIHTRLSPPDALWFCKEAEQYRPYFIEDPLRSEYTQAYRNLRSQTSVPLAFGEQYSSKWDFRQAIEEDLFDYARIDVCICGGLTEAKKIAGWCETHYIDIVVHNPIGPVATAACLHLNLSLPNFGVQETPHRPGESMPDVVTGLPEWKDGYLLPPDKPGLGFEFDREAIKKYPYTQPDRPELHRVDGSFTNW